MNDKNYINLDGLQLRGDGESRLISGRAIVFNSDSKNMGGFVERIMPQAITSELVENSDVFCLYNHDKNQVLARSNKGKGTLALDLDADGVNFMFEAPNTSLGNDVLELVRRGDLTSCSFGFTMPNEKDALRWYRDEDGTLRRDILKIDGLFDVSIVNTPAYSETSVSVREMLDNIDTIDQELDNKLNEIEEL